jgi:hypothetical protein
LLVKELGLRHEKTYSRAYTAYFQQLGAAARDRKEPRSYAFYVAVGRKAL